MEIVYISSRQNNLPVHVLLEILREWGSKRLQFPQILITC
jgi:hypothetical protein